PPPETANPYNRHRSRVGNFYEYGWGTSASAVSKARHVGSRVDNLTNEALDAVVDRVWAVVNQKLGSTPPIRELVCQAQATGSPSPEVQAEAQRALTDAAASDPEFEAELRAALAQLPVPPQPTTVSNTGVVSRGSVVSGPINAAGPVTISASHNEKNITKVVKRATTVVQQHRGPVLVGGIALLVLVVIFVSCAVSGGDRENSLTPTTTLAPIVPTRTSASATSTVQQAATPPPGLLTAAISEDRHSIKYGVLDIATGNYKAFKSFSNPTAKIWHDRDHVSPDWKLIGASINVGREVHAGWIDSAGTFTDVTALLLKNSQQGGDFTRAITHTVIGFDSAGAFYLEDATDQKSTGGGLKIIKVWPANPAIAVDTWTTTKGSSWEHSYYWNWKHDLTLLPPDIETCPSVKDVNDFAWLDQDHFITAKFEGNRLLVWDARKHMCPWETAIGYPHEYEILAEDNPYRISDPWVNPAHDTIAFYSDTGNFTGFYTVSVSGGDPVRTGLTKEKLKGYRIVRWV
ncbi:hypothetical protein, partial [Nocardia sp. NPDC052112]|uniref:hypothetical protein n=1 Tax=Nocardia sp. NPDC052112 TaxID=3155646 RepID=UPI003429E8C1